MNVGRLIYLLKMFTNWMKYEKYCVRVILKKSYLQEVFMAKKDIRTKIQFGWDDYKNKPFDEELSAIYSHAKNTSDAKCTWYWKSIKMKRRISQCIRLLAVILLIVGTILPILAGITDDHEIRLLCTQIGVVALAVAGLLQIADRVFGWSSGWLRYITTATAMENLTRKFELDWASYIVDKGSNIGNSDIKPLFDIAKRFEDDISKLQSDETDTWVKEFNSSVAYLGEMIKSQRDFVEKSVTSLQSAAQERAKAQQKGAVELTIKHPAGPIAAVSIAIDKEPARNFVGTSWARLDLEPKPHTITVTTTTGTIQTIQKIVDVKPGVVERIEVTLS
jgi:hypothetical protein